MPPDATTHSPAIEGSTRVGRPRARYDLLAELFQYPAVSFASAVSTAQAYLDRSYPRAGETLRPFTEFIASATLTEMEELYTRSFDVQAVTTLDIGYVLFGDDYKRAEMLVNLNREHREAGNTCRTELPDHLPNVLRLITRMNDQALAEELVEKMLGPAVARMKAEFSPERVEQRNALYRKHHKTIIHMSETHGRLYGCTLDALYLVLKKDFNLREEPLSTKSSAFLRSVESEMRTEKD